ncbi:AMP-binding protein, partial [Streptomyces sp. NPDC014894]|uniref:AMP-binding protein n=1 Tax=Streptomyces sp. NPDC014894 TaxID=3364931 RepID=UPI0036FA3020
MGELLERVQREQSELLDHQYLSLAEIQRIAGTGTGELFDTTTVFENYPQDPAAFAEAFDAVRLVDVEGRDATHYTLSLAVLPGDELRIRIAYRPDRLDHDTAEDIATRFIRLLETVADRPDERVGRLDVLLEGERRQLLTEWNASGSGSAGRCVPELFEERVAVAPDAVALASAEVSLSYAELNARVNRLAWLLIGAGVGPERVVALAVPRSVETVIAALAVLKAGGAYVPVDPEYPVDRIAYMLGDARPVCVLTTADAASGLPDTDLPRVVLDAPETVEALAASPVSDPEGVVVCPESAAYVIYTSGSTGLPKGVVVSHAGLEDLAVSQVERFGLGGGSRVLQLASFSFDAAVME